ncbi:catechol 2,3-dioxygenase-like lactoylglutathione lyase family enzyme [Jejuia pallidilutea]|jgi:catechol 2,3-dioxygenase-like lactoylglutathione lyase family enzyme|uniref:Catechol 2,3-dioxygenase-like lactoylglutathione lyase family enzyme n=1 Tax=Jejuia pallidilutea TaxID=504487 RepID=A0A362X1D7_9FLAO|nr:VOC family protein [Jejuia pallidilutea]PQV48920.1 catechol 2,3-dioxygenase-like lactoylglutathione lyase family enzyme [Jejuia pallidilutea]
MIKGLYETHLFVENLERSIEFYKNILGLEQCHFEEERRAAFFWIGEPKEAMLGLWEKPKSEIDRRHFAFKCDKNFIINEASEFLKKQGLNPFNFLNDGTDKPMVFAWIPAIAIYFDDPDGHHLEFISVLDGKSNPENGIITYEHWLDLETKEK